ncbi:hypothetical protein Ccur_00630 [Cryptobacterium curtum DSM 15641]|uniref:Uncharacterized protein n=1 Tax=Cryptobacterium curtum (strain ATCC 700683 / DSM 15641 / CCUG 43107 / 12-3) TaxID=469378 RepID=C7MLJ0_CRYCD|nr:hypothetical protein Ccur_00630 [Cryptobacterium curtum DSM 15641]
MGLLLPYFLVYGFLYEPALVKSWFLPLRKIPCAQFDATGI